MEASAYLSDTVSMLHHRVFHPALPLSCRYKDCKYRRTFRYEAYDRTRFCTLFLYIHFVLPILSCPILTFQAWGNENFRTAGLLQGMMPPDRSYNIVRRSEEHTSELQSRG